MKKVLIYSTATCVYCLRAKQLLESQEIPYEEIMVDTDEKLRQHVMQMTGRRTVPQIFIGERHLGGFDDLKALHESGELNAWLKE